MGENYKYNIGFHIKDEKRDIVLTDREIRINNYYNKKRMKTYKIKEKWYKYHCNICGWDDGWSKEGNIVKGNGCACCSNTVVVQGINDIPTVAPWMISYFQGGYDEAKLYTTGSEKRIVPKCPDCGKILKETFIYNIYHHKKCSCVCQDGISFPNKFSYFMFQQVLDQIDYYEREYCPKWLSPYKFDNYFELKNKRYVLEMDGGLGHGKKTYDHKIDVVGKERDCKKEKMAREHNITIIRVDATNDQEIQNNTYKALEKMIDLDNVDWNKVIEFSSKSLIKQVCEFYEENKNEMLLKDIASHFCISDSCINRYLKFGRKYNWCNYVTSREMHEIRLKNTIDLKNKDKSLTQKEISVLLNYSLSSVKQYFKEAYSKNLITR